MDVQAAQKTYPGGVQALLPLSLSVREGEFVTLLGPSGCGKSTLLKMVAGLLAPSSGRVLLWGRAHTTLPTVKRGLGFVFQDATLMPWATALANVRLPLVLGRVPRDEATERARRALAGVGLARFEAALPRALSGGMQMRVSIARSLVTEPALLLMDEPFGALDEITRNRLDSDLLALWRARGLTVLFVTHSIHEAVFLSQRVVVMAARPGRVVEQVAIAEPHPRGPDFRVSTVFSQHARHLQNLLLQASGNDDGAAEAPR